MTDYVVWNRMLHEGNLDEFLNLDKAKATFDKLVAEIKSKGLMDKVKEKGDEFEAMSPEEKKEAWFELGKKLKPGITKNNLNIDITKVQESCFPPISPENMLNEGIFSGIFDWVSLKFRNFFSWMFSDWKNPVIFVFAILWVAIFGVQITWVWAGEEIYLLFMAGWVVLGGWTGGMLGVANQIRPTNYNRY